MESVRHKDILKYFLTSLLYCNTIDHLHDPWGTPCTSMFQILYLASEVKLCTVSTKIRHEIKGLVEDQ